jgi:hypothetical protein
VDLHRGPSAVAGQLGSRSERELRRRDRLPGPDATEADPTQAPRPGARGSGSARPQRRPAPPPRPGASLISPASSWVHPGALPHPCQAGLGLGWRTATPPRARVPPASGGDCPRTAGSRAGAERLSARSPSTRPAQGVGAGPLASSGVHVVQAAASVAPDHRRAPRPLSTRRRPRLGPRSPPEAPAPSARPPAHDRERREAPSAIRRKGPRRRCRAQLCSAFCPT